jgi:hypothetical protein
MESTFKDSNDQILFQWCMIYDKRTGEIIHTHQFYPLSYNDYSKDDLEKIAIEFLSPENKSNMEFLDVFHPPKDLDLDPRMNYKIDLESQSLISEPIDFTAIRMKAKEKEDLSRKEKGKDGNHLSSKSLINK